MNPQLHGETIGLYPYGILNTLLNLWAATDSDWAPTGPNTLRFPSEAAAAAFMRDCPCFCDTDKPALLPLSVWSDEEPVIDDTVHCCPDCETPNQFGELCSRCEYDRQLENHE